MESTFIFKIFVVVFPKEIFLCDTDYKMICESD